MGSTLFNAFDSNDGQNFADAVDAIFGSSQSILDTLEYITAVHNATAVSYSLHDISNTVQAAYLGTYLIKISLCILANSIPSLSNVIALKRVSLAISLTLLLVFPGS